MVHCILPLRLLKPCRACAVSRTQVCSTAICSSSQHTQLCNSVSMLCRRDGGEITIDALHAWCKSLMPKGYGVRAPRLKICRPAQSIICESPAGDQFQIRRDRMSYISRGWCFATFSKRALPGLIVASALALPTLADAKTLTAVMHSDLRVIDPGMTTAYITRDHGYMVYDTLLAMDSNFKVQPQMADWKVSDEKLTYTFTLRDGLKWHEGAPVPAEDCVASLKRWGKNDNMGQKLMDFTASLDAPDAKTIVLKLKEPYGLVLESIGKPSSLVPFMMPKRLAETPPGQQIKGQIGSGPVKVVEAEFQPRGEGGYEENKGYVASKEPP